MPLAAESLTSKADWNALIFVASFFTWTIISVIECISFVGNIFLEFEKKILLLQNMRKMTHLFFHDASILVTMGVFLTHRYETVGVFAHFLCVKNAKTPSIWSSDYVSTTEKQCSDWV